VRLHPRLGLRAGLALAFAAAVAGTLALFSAGVLVLMTRSERQEQLHRDLHRPRPKDDGTPEELPQVLDLMLLLFPLAVGAAGGLGFVLARRALAPLKEASQRARQARASEEPLLLPVSGRGDEWDDLAITLNALLTDQRQSMERIHRFTANAAHELRTPLTAIIGESEVALRKPRSVDELRAALEIVHGESRRLSRLVDSLLVLAKGEARGLLGHASSIDAETLVHSAAERARARVQRAGGRAKIVVTGTAGPLWGEAQLLTRALENLLENALTHGGPSVHCALGTDAGGVVVDVSDDGPGVLESLGDVFEPLVRREDGPGAGLGLTIARTIAEAHGGTLDLVRSDHGAHFRLRLPRAPG
jgi:signal transduction histidine kinase